MVPLERYPEYSKQPMDQRLAKLLRDYSATVVKAVQMLEAAGIPRPESDGAWVGTRCPWHGKLSEGFEYFKHGFGVVVCGPAWSIDFDFGANGELDGYDPHRVLRFAEKVGLASYGFASADDVSAAFKDAIEAGILVHSGYILYYLARHD